MMSIEELQSILPPPIIGTENESLDWVGLECENNLKFPDDFKGFIEIYGTGSIGNFLWVLNPFSLNDNLNREAILYFQDSYRVMKEMFSEDYERPLYPENKSFLTWAATDNGDSLFWIVDGEPNSWKVGIHSSDQGDEELFDMNMSKFLAALVKKKISSQILPQDFLSDKIEFSASRF